MSAGGGLPIRAHTATVDSARKGGWLAEGWEGAPLPGDAASPEDVRGTIDSYFEPVRLAVMPTAVKKTISLPPELARAAERMAQLEGKTLSAVVQDALREARASRLRRELDALQEYWSGHAKKRGILSEEDLARYLAG